MSKVVKKTCRKNMMQQGNTIGYVIVLHALNAADFEDLLNPSIGVTVYLI